MEIRDIVVYLFLIGFVVAIVAARFFHRDNDEMDGGPNESGQNEPAE